MLFRVMVSNSSDCINLKEIIDSEGSRVVSARELHEFLEVHTSLTRWIEWMFEYGFMEGTDFITILLESTDGRPSIDFVLF